MNAKTQKTEDKRKKGAEKPADELDEQQLEDVAGGALGLTGSGGTRESVRASLRASVRARAREKRVKK